MAKGKCTCGKPARPGQYNCVNCARASVRKSAKKCKEYVAQLEHLVEQLTNDNRDTRHAFETTIINRFVYVNPRPGDPYPPISGYVSAFKPGLIVSVMEGDGKVTDIPMDRLQSDPTPRRYYDPRARSQLGFGE
jgi:hypothetical protein